MELATQFRRADDGSTKIGSLENSYPDSDLSQLPVPGYDFSAHHTRIPLYIPDGARRRNGAAICAAQLATKPNDRRLPHVSDDLHDTLQHTDVPRARPGELGESKSHGCGKGVLVLAPLVRNVFGRTGRQTASNPMQHTNRDKRI